MSSSTPNLKFLLDENVKVKLNVFLKDQGFDIEIAQKGATDTQLASISKKEKRILVTNDGDFQWYPKQKIYSVIWLRIPQDNNKALITSFQKLLRECDDFAGKIVILEVKGWKDYPLPMIIEV